MRLACDIEVVDRALATLNVKKSSKPIRAQISVGKSSSAQMVFMMVCTAKDKSGTKYKIKDNIDKVFTKCLNEGKATIRLKQPEKDLCISKADVVHLKSFLNVIRMVLQGKELDRAALSSLMPAKNKNVERPKSHLVITSKKNYPITTNFPMSLTCLEVHGCGMKKLDTRICKLRNLVTLDLCDNNLTDLPEDISKLPLLAELKLRNNKFETFPVNICRHQNLQNTLKLLDLSHNQIKELPVQICELKQLYCLKMGNNVLEDVSPTIGRLQALKVVSLEGNQLKMLPAGFLHLSLDTVDLYGNCFEMRENTTSADQVDVPSLMECAARFVRKHRLPYSSEDLHLPLCRYLDAARLCWCGNYCFQCSVVYWRMVDLRRIASSVTGVDVSGSTLVPVQGYLCSPQCLNKFKIDPHAYWR